MRYNIVLVPDIERIKIFEELSQRYFSDVHSGYLLDDGSIPHVTLCQFECEESLLEKFLNRFYAKFNKLSCVPEFSGLSLIKLDGQFTGLQAAELSVVRSPGVMTLHRNATEFIQQQGIKNLNSAGDVYRPHLTLAFFDPAHATNTNIPLSLPSDIFESMSFKVAIGAADKNWQFNKIIKESNIRHFLRSKCKYSQEDMDSFNKAQCKLGITLTEFLEGKIFSESPYTEKEIKQILHDLANIVSQQFSDQTYNENPFYLTTAGAPASGKSFHIENTRSLDLARAVYIEPDRVGLLGLSSYLDDKEKHGDTYAYNKWRDASNFIANFMLVKACAESRNIIHGTTATNPKIIKIYKTLKDLGYQIKVELLFADIKQRILAGKHRAKDIMQVTDEDFHGKVRPVFFRINDAYLKYGDSIDFYFQHGDFWLGNGRLVKFATFSQTNKILYVLDKTAMKSFHDEMNRELTLEEVNQFKLSLNELLQKRPPSKSQFNFFRESNDNQEETHSLSMVGNV